MAARQRDNRYISVVVADGAHIDSVIMKWLSTAPYGGGVGERRLRRTAAAARRRQQMTARRRRRWRVAIKDALDISAYMT